MPLLAISKTFMEINAAISSTKHEHIAKYKRITTMLKKMLLTYATRGGKKDWSRLLLRLEHGVLLLRDVKLKGFIKKENKELMSKEMGNFWKK